MTMLRKVKLLVRLEQPKSTGPHLHWSVLMNNTYVDPEMLLNKRIINNLNLEGS